MLECDVCHKTFKQSDSLRQHRYRNHGRDSLKDPRIGTSVDPPNCIDLDIYRSCRKLSVLPEEEATGDDSPPGSRLAMPRYPEQQSHSFESYLLPAPTCPHVIRQLSDPTTSRSTRRPLQISTSGGPVSEERVGVRDSGLGSESRIPSPTFTTLQDTATQLVTISYSSDPDLDYVITLRTPAPLSPEAPFKTPPDLTPSSPNDITPSSPNQISSSDTSLSFQTPTEITPGTESPTERLPLDRLSLVCIPIPEKPMLSVLLDDNSLPPPPPQALDAPNEGPLRRVPSKRGKVPLVRSMARTDSKSALGLPSGESSPSGSASGSPSGGKAANGSSSPGAKTSNGSNGQGSETPNGGPKTSNGSCSPAGKSHSAQNGSANATNGSSSPGGNPTNGCNQLKTSNGSSSSGVDTTTAPNEASDYSSNGVLISVPVLGEAVSIALPPPVIQDSDANLAQGSILDLPANEDKNGLNMEKQENQAVFPSLSDAALRQLGLFLQASSSDEREVQLTDGDVESKYTSLVLAFKTDKLTLARRLELQNKLRDQAEINMTTEFDALKSVVQLLSTVCVDAEKAETFEKIKQQVDTLYKATLRVSSTAEMYGVVQQENRLSKAMEMVLRHVDNLKQAHDKEKADHDETKKLVQKETKPVSPAVSALKNNGKRRASIATLHQGQSHSEAVHASSMSLLARLNSVEGSKPQYTDLPVVKLVDLETCKYKVLQVNRYKTEYGNSVLMVLQPLGRKPVKFWIPGKYGKLFSEEDIKTYKEGQLSFRKVNNENGGYSLIFSEQQEDDDDDDDDDDDESIDAELLGTGATPSKKSRMGKLREDEDQPTPSKKGRKKQEEKMLRRGSSSRRGSRSQLRRSNTHKDELKSESNVDNVIDETLHNISEKVDRRCSHSHSLHPDDQGLSGASHPNSCTEGETDTDDDLYYERLQELRKQEIEIQKRLPNRYKFRKRSSFCAPPWVLKMMAYLHWLQPYEDFAMQARYTLAGIFILTAIGIVVSNFFVSQES